VPDGSWLWSVRLECSIEVNKLVNWKWVENCFPVNRFLGFFYGKFVEGGAYGAVYGLQFTVYGWKAEGEV